MPFVETPNVVLHCHLDGDEAATPLVLVNSLGADCRIWDAFTAEIRDRFHVLRYDQRGQGLSDSPPGPYSILDHATDLIALLDRLLWRSALLCGLSIGGMIAMETCARRRDLVCGLVLADTSDVIGSREFWATRINQIRQHGLGPIAQSILERWFGATFRRSRPSEVRGWANLLRRSPVDGYLGSCAALRDADLSRTVGAIAVPTLCIYGSEDQATPPATVRRLAARIPGASSIEIAGAGHLPPVERPREFAEHLTGFWEGRFGV